MDAAHTLAASAGIVPQDLDAALLRTQRALARREEPTQLLASLLDVLLASTGASAVGVHSDADGQWILPAGAGPSHRLRFDRSRTTPSPDEWLIDVPVEDGPDPLGRLVLVVLNTPGAQHPGLGFDTPRLVEVITMLLLAMAADSRVARSAPGTPATAPVDTPMTASMRRDLVAGRFIPHFQPVVDLATGSVAAFDALVRWNHAQRGWINATEFFPQAKKAGLVAELESVVFRQAAIRARCWLDRGTPRVRVNVKVSGSRFESPELLDELTGLIREFHLPAATLGIMVTEKTLLRPTAVTALPSMRDAGFRITVEHFGTQPTTTSMLRSLPLYGLKIDGSIVRRLGTDPAAERAAQAVVLTARSLDLKTMGESIETDDQRAALQALGCNAGQGFLWSPAVEGEVADSIMKFQTFAGRARRRSRLGAIS